MDGSPDLYLNYGFLMMDGKIQAEYDVVEMAKLRTFPVSLFSVKTEFLNLGFLMHSCLIWALPGIL